jgi:transmembrane sensor
MDQQRFWQLVTLKLSGEATPEEMQELEQLMQHSSEGCFKLDVISGIWNETGRPAEPALPFKNHLQRLKNAEASSETNAQKSQQPPSIERQPQRRIISYLAIAASVLALVFCGYYLFQQNQPVKSHAKKGSNIVATQKGSRTTVQLPDGTKVWLNADSKLYYDESFEGDSREVELEGEAFFDVKKDSCRPFLIHTNAVDIKVLGTRFNVKSYRDEDETETALVTGSLEVRLKKNPEKKIVLQPNEKLVVKHNLNLDTSSGKPGDDTMLFVKPMRQDAVYKTSPETLWMQDKLVFDGETLEDVCKTLERWYNVKIEIRDESLKSQIYTAIFDGETLLNVLTALKLTDRIDFTINNKQVLIFNKKTSTL